MKCVNILDTHRYRNQKKKIITDNLTHLRQKFTLYNIICIHQISVSFNQVKIQLICFLCPFFFLFFNT